MPPVKLSSETRQFLNRSSGLIEKLGTLMFGYDSSGDISGIHEILRMTHSIKSEASFLGLDPLSLLTEKLEKTVLCFRDGTLKSFQEHPVIFQSLDVLSVLIYSYESGSETLIPYDIIQELDTIIPELEPVVIKQLPPEPQKASPEDLENTLIQESFLRGETLYSISVKISENELMPHVRAYLIRNSIEDKFNLIRHHPAISRDVYQYNYLISTSESEEEIDRELQLDQIESFEVCRQEYPTDSEESVIEDFESSDISDSHYRSELLLHKKDLSRLDDCIRLLSAHENIREEESLLRVIEEMQGISLNLGKISFNNYMKTFSQLVIKLEQVLDKSIKLVFPDRDCLIDPQLLFSLREVYIQLIRNAAVHGMETRSERRRLPKPLSGSITLDIKETGSDFILSVSDDGRGIAIEESADEMLQKMIQPGFSTAPRDSHHAGRGIGLDLVNRIITEQLGGKLALKSEPGWGTVFFMTIPKVRSNGRIAFFRFKNRVYGLESRHIVRYEAFHSDMAETSLQYMTPDHSDPAHCIRGTVIVIRRDDRLLGLICDELLMTADSPGSEGDEYTLIKPDRLY